ncbi:MAG: maltokinase N-terminal cap-like domain-containing protein [Candidatus Dormibacteria bacterium]
MPSEIETLDDVITRSGPGRALDMIGAYVVRQRWSGAIGRSVSDVRIVDAVRLEDIETPVYFTVTHIAFDDGTARDYALPLGHRAAGDPLAERAPDFVIGGLPGVGPARFLYDALGDPEYVLWLWRGVHREVTLRTATATLRFTVFDREQLDADLDPSLRLLGVEQSNTSLIVGDETFLKHLRRVEPGPSQELEMLSALRRAGFTQLAALEAAVLYEPSGAPPSPLVLVQPFLHNGTEGWTLALTSLRSLYAVAEEAATGDDEWQRAAIDEHGADFAPEAARMGSVVAQMHAALTKPGLGDEFTPEPVTAADLALWAVEMTKELDALLARPDAVLDELRRNRDTIAAVFDAVSALQPSGLRARVHGDLHLGQTLRTDSGWVILDFEGEPDRSPEQRRRRTSPLVDVAGMLRSFDYAAAVALAERILPQSADWEGMLAFGEAWSGACRAAFWSAYLEGAAASGLLPDTAPAEVLRRAFELQKAVYETAYELGHRPTWAPIPLRFLLGEAV